MLLLLAQINFEETPHLEGFPASGILQFFVEDGDMSGFNYDDRFMQDGFRVVYYPKDKVDEKYSVRHFRFPAPKKFVLPDEIWNTLPQLPAPLNKYKYRPKPDFDFPVRGEYSLKFTLEKGTVTFEDFRFAKITSQKLSLEAKDWYTKNSNQNGHKIGGYPHFAQDDPRFSHWIENCSSELKPYSILLFQMDSDFSKSKNGYNIIWGDAGVANFFIKPEDLAARDFSNVLYNWDCY